MVKRIFLFSIFLAYGCFALAQQRELKISDYALWNTINRQAISNNGAYVLYEVNQNKGDGKLVVYNVNSATDKSFNYGYSASFSSCSRYVAFNIKASEDTLRKLKLAKVKSDKMPKDSLAILSLTDMKIVKHPGIISFKLSDQNSSWISFLSEYQKPKPDTAKKEDKKEVRKPAPAKSKKKRENNVLTILNPVDGSKHIFNRVEQYEIAKKSAIVGLTAFVNDTSDLVNLIIFNGSTQKIDTISRHEATFKRLTFDEQGTQLAYLMSTDTIAEKRYSLFYSPIGKYNIQRVVDTTSVSIPKGWMPRDNGSIYFSEDGTKLFFGTAPIPRKKPKEEILDEEKPKLDLWSWTDSEIQPVQLKAVNAEKRKTFLALYRIKEKKTIQIADTIVSDIRLISKRNGEIALGIDANPYRRSRVWSSSYLSDSYLIDLKTGKRTPLLKSNERVQLSPQGKYAIWYSTADSSYYAADTKTQKIISLTKQIPVAFYDEEHDTPSQPGSYGVMGWANNDEKVFIYDRYDIWQIDPTGKLAPTCITKGRKDLTSYRYQRLDDEIDYIPTKTDIILRAFNQKTIQDGYFSLQIDNPSSLKKLIMGDYRLGSITKAKNSNNVLWSIQTVSKFPDIILSDLSFSNYKTISNANPFLKDFIWPTAELVIWKSFVGDSLRGILYKPNNFDSSKKYPMISYFYEKSSDGLHRFMTPQPSRSTINISFYVSNGYIVFVPDINYRTGYPGQSAYDAIVSGAYHLTNTRNYIDSKRLGLQGQSWGGYQIAYLVTQTDMFAAAMAGAPVSNMTSAYGGIRWGTGMSRMFQYEETQSRIGGTLWDKPLHYIENSPVFFAPKVKTPLLIMSNDNDGAVPWYQGIEMFMALYRLNKPAWLINYNGMDHNLEGKYWANRIDLDTRMFQFFNHFLKGEPAPEWMVKGIPAIDKGTKLGY